MAGEPSPQSLKLRLHISLHGAVQGVGFRPFIYRLAKEIKLDGWVCNSSHGVIIEVEGEKGKLDQFTVRIQKERPPRAFIQRMEVAFLDVVGYIGFEIRESHESGEKDALILPDIATCSECVKEIFDPRNRRYLYPFTNCTNCGPRFSIIKSLPYDRANTTMQKFRMCEECREEYENPSDRRFHAQPNACPNCGPHVELWNKDGVTLSMRHDAILEAADAVRNGKIVALKGIGGFQLLVDARNEEAVKLLRRRKHREEKPFALMYPSVQQVKLECKVSEIEERLLTAPEAPIVILARKDISETEEVTHARFRIASSVAPKNPYLGIMLPYTPLHQILMRELNFPVVATSGNLSNEPICIDENEALDKLGGIADVFLVHDRPIERPVDDSVVRLMANRVQLIRRARGYAPFPIEIGNVSNVPVLAVGGHLKNTVAVNVKNNVFISQHIGDLETKESYDAFEKIIVDFQKLYEVSPAFIVHDAHPDYLSTRFARKSRIAEVEVQHHFAHIASCIAENQLDATVLGVSWDGTGYGEDGTVWGGEFLITDGITFERVATFRSFRLIGSSASVKEPRRAAVGLLYEIFGEELFSMEQLEPVRAFHARWFPALKKMLESGVNSPITTSVGRLFDAVSSIVGLRQIVTFEGQGAMELEFALGGISNDNSYEYEVDEKARDNMLSVPHGGEGTLRRDPSYIVNWEPMFREILADKSKNVPVEIISAKFHNTLANIIVDVAEKVGQEKVVLSGGCFQNKYLTEKAVEKLLAKGFKPYWHQRVPTNDGGISLGQIFVTLKAMFREQRTAEKKTVEKVNYVS